MSGPAEPDFRLTYASMFDPPPALHQRFDAAGLVLELHQA